MKPFKEYMIKSAEDNNSRLIFNLDLSAEIDFLNYEGEKEKVDGLKEKVSEL